MAVDETRLQRLAVAADELRVDRIRRLFRGGRVLAGQRAILRTMERWRDGQPKGSER